MSDERLTISRDYCDDVGDALRYAYGGTDQYYPSQWENAIKGLKKTLQAKTATPGASQQVIEPDSGYDGLTAVTVSGDADLVAGNIKKDVEIFGVTGTYEGGGGGRVTQDSSGMLTLSEDGSIVAEVPLSVTQNGRSVPPTGYAYSEVDVAVSGGSATLITKNIIANGNYPASADNVDGFSSVLVAVPNTYAAGDEGKVVSSGALVSQSSLSVNSNGTYDTTLKNSVVVTVPASGVNIPVLLTITTPPTKTSYTAGEALDLTGIVVTATYANGTTQTVTSGCTFSPANGATLSTAGTQTITATYTYINTSSGNNYAVTVTDTTNVTVISANSVNAKLGGSSTITTLSGMYGPLGNSTNNYIDPVNNSNQDVTLDLTQPYEIKVAFKLTQAITDGKNKAVISSGGVYGMPYVTIGQTTDGTHYNITCELHPSSGTSVYLNFTYTEFLPVVNVDAYIRLVYDGSKVTLYANDGSGSEVSKTANNFTPVQVQAAYPRIAGTSTSSDYSLAGVNGAYIDIDNTYIKQNNTLIWGVPQS